MSSTVIWYDIHTKQVLGTGMLHVLEEEGKRFIDSIDWNEETQIFIENYEPPIVEPGPWWYWEDGKVYQSPPEA